MESCMVQDCPNERKSSPEGITFHKLTQGELQQEWLNSLGLTGKDRMRSQSEVICSEHFKEEDFTTFDGMRSLKFDAVPSLKLGRVETKGFAIRTDTYKKSRGNAGLSGVQFQLNLLTVSLLNVLRYRTNWRISTENQEAGKYDDIVIELEEKSAVLIQCKHKDNRKVSKDQLFSTNSRNADFSLPKYFFSYEEIKSKFKAKTVVICTNAEFDKRGLENSVTSQCVSSDNLLYYEGDDCSFFTFNENIIQDLKANAQIYYDNNLQGKGIDKTVITDENLKGFLKDLQFFSKYPSGEKLNKIIGQLLFRLKDSSLFCTASPQEIHEKVEDWFKQPKGEYLTEIRAKAMFCEVKSNKYCESLKNYNLLFARNNFIFTGSKRIFHIKTERGHLLQMLKIYRALEKDKSIKLFIDPDETIEVLLQMIEAFKLRRYTFLIMIWSEIAPQISDMLKQILEKDQYKKVILVSESHNSPFQQVGSKETIQLNGSITFKDFSRNSQKAVLNRKHVSFQGEIISLEQLFVSQTVEDYAKVIDSETLEMLVRRENVKVGTRFLNQDKDTARYYIDRTFVRNIGDCYGKEVFPEENICDVAEKIILIGDSAGMGKSTVLTKLAATMKQRYPHLWVIRINLNEYTTVLWDLLRKNKKDASVIELLNSQEATKLASEFERLVFSTSEKVVLMLDGVDEISPNYTNLILDMLRQCQQQSNFAKVFVTTRPHVVERLEEILNVASFKMLPFTLQNQKDFLTKYWLYNLQLSDTYKNKCEEYAATLISKMSSWIKYYYHEYSFTAIPLQVRIMAEIFQQNTQSMDWEGCKEYLSGTETVPKLPGKFNIAELYDIFFERKRDIFLERECASRNPAAHQALLDKFDECLDHHRSLALKATLDEAENNLFGNSRPSSKDAESYILKMGIVQKSGDELQFLHRTFAEYFVAKSILRELVLRNPNAHFQKLVIDKVLVSRPFNIVRAFLDYFLREVVDSLPPNIFENYQRKTSKHELSEDKIIFVLSEESCVSILRLILKIIRFKIDESKKVKITNYFNKMFRKTNTLNILQYNIRKFGVNIRNREGYTPLHRANEQNHLEMVKFLIDQGADVNIKDNSGQTVLHSATRHQNWDNVKYFLERGADVNSNDSLGWTVLHIALSFDDLDIIKHFVERGANIKSRDRDGCTVLHTATKYNNLDAAKYLLERGVDVNSQDNQGRTVLHLAAKFHNWDTAKYFLKCGADVNSADCDGRTVLHMTAAHHDLNVVKDLIEHGADVNDKDNFGHTALYLAAASRNWDVVEFFVECGADVNNKDTDGSTALNLAASFRNWSIMKYLVECGADVNSRDGYGHTVLHSAVGFGDFEPVEFLTEQGIDANIKDSRGCTALNLAARSGDWDTVRYLIERGADINSADSSGGTVLYSAAKSLDWDTVRYLIEHGADINTRDNSDETVLHSAARYGDLDIIKYLVTHGADVNNKDSYGDTVLHAAAGLGDLDTVKYLVKCGANVNSTDGFGRTVLHSAARSRNWDAVRYFVKCGVDIDSKDSDGSTILHSAAKFANLDVVKHLVNCGADFNNKNNGGRTVLHSAAKFRNWDTIKYFLECGVDVNGKDNSGRTVLYLAFKSRDLDIVKHLMECGANIFSKDIEGRTALDSVDAPFRSRIVAYLQEIGVDITSTESYV